MPARYYPAILYWLCFLGLIICAISSDIQNSQPTQLSTHNKEGQPNQTQNPNHQINSSAGSLVRFSVEFGKNDESQTDWGEPNCAHPKNHDEADICQQMKMAHIANDTYKLGKWQLILGLFTIVGLIASIYISGMAANAARASADALPILERAYLYFNEIEPIAIKYHLSNQIAVARSTEPLYPAARITVKNYGKTPASYAGGELLLVVTNNIPPKITSATPNPEERGVPEDTDIFLGEGGVGDLGSFGAKTEYTVEMIMDVKSGDLAIYCHGWIKYNDMLENTHEIVFCRRYDVSKDCFVPVGGAERNYMKQIT
jgi:hypothetical protein